MSVKQSHLCFSFPHTRRRLAFVYRFCCYWAPGWDHSSPSLYFWAGWRQITCFNENTRRNSQWKRAATFALCRRLALCFDALVPREQFPADVARFWTVSHSRRTERIQWDTQRTSQPIDPHIKGIFTRCPHSGLWLKSNGFSFRIFCSLSPRGYKMEWSGWVSFFSPTMMLESYLTIFHKPPETLEAKGLTKFIRSCYIVHIVMSTLLSHETQQGSNSKINSK